jgi:glucose-6-phosphate 1-dehydrogenase
LYYDKAGALRDMVQNHLFQMLSLIAMEPPTNLKSESIRDEKAKVFTAIKPFKNDWNDVTVFGQYGPGKIMGKKVVGYVDEDRIPKNSRTETYVALKVEVDNLRWTGVPFYLRTGKRLKDRGTYVVIEFKKMPKILFNEKDNLEPNKLIIKVQPEESIKMQFNVKSPDWKLKINPIVAEFDHKQFFGLNSPEAYENILFNVVKNDKAMFNRWDSVEKSWEIVDKLVNCRDNCPFVYKYPPGTWGPEVADKLLEKTNHKWHNVM